MRSGVRFGSSHAVTIEASLVPPQPRRLWTTLGGMRNIYADVHIDGVSLARQ